MIESWMVNVVIGVGTLILGYGILKNKVSTIEERQNKHDEEDRIFHADLDRKMNAQFKRIDECNEVCLSLEAKIGNCLDLPKAELRFVSKEELALHIKNIDLELAHINKNSDIMMGKLDDLTSALHDFILGGK